jgi:hypothetical protein
MQPDWAIYALAGRLCDLPPPWRRIVLVQTSDWRAAVVPSGGKWVEASVPGVVGSSSKVRPDATRPNTYPVAQTVSRVSN